MPNKLLMPNSVIFNFNIRHLLEIRNYNLEI